MGNELIKKVKALILEEQVEEFIEVIPCVWMPTFIFKIKMEMLVTTIGLIFAV